jgi:hypothetical protein
MDRALIDSLYCLQANEAADRWEKKRLRVRIEERP